MAPMREFLQLDRGLCRDFLISCLLVVFFSLAILIRIVNAGGLAGTFDQDTLLAASLGHRYILLRFEGPVVDMYTHGFLHPFLYVPLIAIVRALGVSPPLQYSAAIACVQCVSVGAIALLAYWGCRQALRRLVSVVVVLLCLVPPFLIFPIDFNLTPVSPNAEIIGSVPLLLLWLLALAPALYWRRAPIIVLVVVGLFHFKYQLLPQALSLLVFPGLSLRRLAFLVVAVLVTALFVDLGIYRLGEHGFIANVHSLVSEYVGLYSPASPAPDGSALTIKGMAAWFIVQAFTLFHTLSSRVQIYLGHLSTGLSVAPAFFLAWLAWLVLLARRGSLDQETRRRLRLSLLLSFATIVAILLPGKNFLHYYLLLVPTSIIVMAMSLGMFPRFACTLTSPRAGGCVVQAPLFRLVPLLICSLLPSILALALVVSQLNRPLVLGGSSSWSLIPADARAAGLHVFGWDFRLFGSQDTFSVNLDLDKALFLSWLRKDAQPYVKALVDPRSSPRFILDYVSSPAKGYILAAAGYPPLAKLSSSAGIDLLGYYRVRQMNELGILYERLDAPGMDKNSFKPLPSR